MNTQKSGRTSDGTDKSSTIMGIPTDEHEPSKLRAAGSSPAAPTIPHGLRGFQPATDLSLYRAEGFINPDELRNCRICSSGSGICPDCQLLYRALTQLHRESRRCDLTTIYGKAVLYARAWMIRIREGADD